MGVPRDRLVTYLDQYLEVAGWEEKALNGLQVEGAPEVERVALATDAALATFALAGEAGAQFLIVHHGLFWGRVEAIVGPRRERIAALLDAGISLYAVHLPLDAHPGIGNNAVLARLLKLENLLPFGRWGTRTIGWRGQLPAATDLATLAAGLEALLGARPDVLPFGADEVRSVAVVSGAAADLVSEVAESRVDAFVTGETSHVAWHHARELGVNVFFAGHYATETLGVRALGDHLAGEFGLETVFLDSPTGY
ncbi:MAG TPA: Nif3-like dinuclear metal center hexameric protein [Gemmatimonadota bacterium]|nr:Nif3-like dinuclear metal center hexameric protein [Gemmatimonadota bacterium]